MRNKKLLFVDRIRMAVKRTADAIVALCLKVCRSKEPSKLTWVHLDFGGNILKRSRCAIIFR